MEIENELSKTYEPKDVEKKWYPIWEKGKYFSPRPGKQKKAYTIIMPPPNVTGVLHMGHALDATTQDALIRFKRMKGYEALWLPGMDHAGIATQSVVEKKVWEEEKKTRHDYDRETFLKKIWEWKDKHGGVIAEQLRGLGASPDWDYFIFTMDKEANEAVRKVFVDLYNEGLIYQADYIVNWDPILQSAISDAEVEHEEVKGAFYHILYPVKNSDIKLEVATTRPETLLGDTAVAVNPNDDRFKHLIGKTAVVPICNREVPIIGDDYVDMEKGTGCLKVTPGHDFNDFEIGKRHQLPIVNILNKDGTLNHEGQEFAGLSCKNARTKIVEKLKELGLYVDEKVHIHQVGHGQRSHEIIEPMVSKQWFLNVQEMAKVATQAVETDQTKFFPKGWENTYFSWLRHPKDWCISRQLWWGHQIPVYYCQDCNHSWASETDSLSCPKCKSKKFIQDPDVLDTWFSSGLWAFSTLGWPDPKRMQERQFEKFFPTDCLVTGFDIIFFWVARMMMMTLKTTGKVPFKHVYIHAIVRDKQGRKMSKSLGNGIDPLQIIDQYGADALRITLASGSGYNRNLNLDPERIAGYRNFINKIWNAFRFIHPFLNEASDDLPQNLDHHERWILSELNETTKLMNDSLEEYRFDDSCSAIYSFVYDRFCSWFIEISKPILYGHDQIKKQQRSSVLKFGFKKIAALLHPFTPFITEELWSALKKEKDELLIIQEYPEFDSAFVFNLDQQQMSRLIDVITQIRNIRSSVGLSPKEKIKLNLFTDDKDMQNYYQSNLDTFKALAGIETLEVFSKSQARPKKSGMRATPHTEIFIPLEGVIDLNQQVAKLNKDLEKIKKEFEKVSKKLENPQFLSSAPNDVIEEVKDKAHNFEEQIKSIESNLHNFS